jgi:hypothetical protein
MIAVVRARSVSNPVAWPFLLAGVETTDDPHGVHVIKEPHLGLHSEAFLLPLGSPMEPPKALPEPTLR